MSCVWIDAKRPPFSKCISRVVIREPEDEEETTIEMDAPEPEGERESSIELDAPAPEPEVELDVYEISSPSSLQTIRP
jgi:hypothetical protein